VGQVSVDFVASVSNAFRRVAPRGILPPMPHVYFIWAVGFAAIIYLVRLYLSEKAQADDGPGDADRSTRC
jgi:hypothetical protein